MKLVQEVMSVCNVDPQGSKHYNLQTFSTEKITSCESKSNPSHFRMCVA